MTDQTQTYAELEQELKEANDALRAAYKAFHGTDDDELGRAWGKAEQHRDMVAQALRATPKPRTASSAPVDYGRCKECGAKLTKFDVKFGDREGYCYNCGS